MADESNLLAQVKRKLRIDEGDTEDDTRIGEVVETCSALLEERIGIDEQGFDFSEAGEENALLVNMCMYEWSDALDDFWANYAAEVETARSKWMRKQYLAEIEEADQDAQ